MCIVLPFGCDTSLGTRHALQCEARAARVIALCTDPTSDLRAGQLDDRFILGLAIVAAPPCRLLPPERTHETLYAAFALSGSTFAAGIAAYLSAYSETV